MKTLLLAAVSLFVAVVSLGGPEDSAAVAPSAGPEPAAASLVGTWYAFPAGMLVTFDGDGQIHLGDPAVGYTADGRLVDGRLHIRFTDYDGEEAACRSATGVYMVSQSDDTIRFEVQGDPCQLRRHVLSGQPDFAPDLRFHRAS